MDRALTRRSLVAATAAAVGAATVPTLAGASPDTALLALREPYERTLATMNAAAKPHSRAEDACFAMAEAQPHLDERARRRAIFKARVSDREDNMDLDLVASIVADLIAMGGAHA